MKVVVDTCGWIEWLTDGSLADKFAPFLKNSKQLIIPTLIQYELFKWVCRERDEAAAYEVIALTQRSEEIIPIDTSLALLGAEISLVYRLAMADALVYATALHYNAKVITSDKLFSSLIHVEYFVKSAE
jgi:predicted nucleic acid-binding protein